jgi:hypothetical protein
MNHARTALIAVGMIAAWTSAPAAAQVDPGIISQGQVLGGTARGYAERGGWRGATPPERRRPRTTRSPRNSDGSTVASVCRDLPAFRARYRVPDARMVKLAGMCRRSGY